MTKKFVVLFLIGAFLIACNKDKKILDALADYNNAKMTQGYHFGDKIALPAEVLENSKSISISFGDKNLDRLEVAPAYFHLGENDVTFNIVKNDGRSLQQDATINVYAKRAPQKLSYKIAAVYPHDPNNFTEGFFMEGNTVYESVGLEGKSKLMKYTLGSITPQLLIKQADDIFAEGTAAINNKIYQLTYTSKIGFIYDKSSFKTLGTFDYNPRIAQGWGMTSDGKNLISSDGSNKIYFLDGQNPSQILRSISVADDRNSYDFLNELEFHGGFIYANVWQKPIILKIDPKNGEVAAIFDLSAIVKENAIPGNQDAVLNGIAFKGDHIVITGKNWKNIYELEIKP